MSFSGSYMISMSPYVFGRDFICQIPHSRCWIAFSVIMDFQYSLLVIIAYSIAMKMHLYIDGIDDGWG